jgi:hypothetical protein
MSLAELSLAMNNLIIPGQGVFGSDTPTGDGNIEKLFTVQYSYPR